MYKRLRGFGFVRQLNGTWVRPAEPGHWTLRSWSFQRGDSSFLEYVPMLVVAPSDGYFWTVSVWRGKSRKGLVDSGDEQQAAAAIQACLDEHRTRGRLNKWWHFPA